jgi:hypothetical protein
MLDRSAHRANAIAFNEDLTGLEQGTCVYLQQSRRVQHDRSGSLWLCRKKSYGKKPGQRKDKDSTWEENLKSPHEYDYAALAPFLSMDN